jgi:ATP-dependent RNA helicase RhlB
VARSVLKKVGELLKKLTGGKKKQRVIPAQHPPVARREDSLQPRRESRSGRPGRDQRRPPGDRSERQSRPDQGRGGRSGQHPERQERQARPERPKRSQHSDRLDGHEREQGPEQSERAPRARRDERPRREGQQRGPRRPEEPTPPAEEPRRDVTPWDPGSFAIPESAGKVRFHDLDLPPEVMRAVQDLGFQYCTPIQSGLLPQTIAGSDATGRAQTGTGKTAAFLITILTRFLRNDVPAGQKEGTPRALVLAPTRELVLQIDKDARALSKYTPYRCLAVFGGMDYRKQQTALDAGPVDIVAATPGRLLDFKRNRKIDLSRVEVLVIDEADRMLDMGFIPDVRRIIESTPMKGKRQTMFFSATLTPEVNRLAAAWTRDPIAVDVTPPQDITLATIDQVVYIITDEEKLTLLYNLITKHQLERVMVFANRRDEAKSLKERLTVHGIQCGLLSGEVEQAQRVKTLEAFRNGKFRVLVATDVAARGLHIDGVSHVVNYSLPMDAEDYVHRIGRTGRAGASGTSVSFATEMEAYEIPKVEEYIGRSLTAVHPDALLLEPLPPLPEGVELPAAGGRGGRSGSRRGGRGGGGGRGRRGGSRRS